MREDKESKMRESEWQHPAKAVAESFDATLDANNDAPGPTQKEKMEWMEPVNVDQERRRNQSTDSTPLMMGQNPMEFYRFGFDGEALCDSTGRIHPQDDPKKKKKGDGKLHAYFEGLHHHGDDPLKPGYTVAELMHLCRSSVANQRSTAVQTMTCIVHRMRCGDYDRNGRDHCEYLWILLQHKGLVRLVIDLVAMEKNISCIIPLL